MMEENRAEQLFFLWEKISEGEIRLLRVFGEQPVVTVPGFIDGRCVQELGDYCFSRRKLPENEIRYSRYCGGIDRKSTRLNSSHVALSRMPSSA